MKTHLMKAFLGAIALTALAASPAQAHWSHREQAHSAHDNRGDLHSRQINVRQDRQQDRIRAGLRSGTLTHAEFSTLMHEQRHIRVMERHFRADGHIDAREARRLNRALDTAGRSIRAEKHDRQVRHAYGDRSRFN